MAETKQPLPVTINHNGDPKPNPRRAHGTRRGPTYTDRVVFQCGADRNKDFWISFTGENPLDCSSPFKVSPGNPKTCNVKVPGTDAGVPYGYVISDNEPDVARERMAAVGDEPPEMIID